VPTLSGAAARARFDAARHAYLATADAGGLPHLVPVTFALLGDALVTAVDHKPKSGARLRRLRNITANPLVSLLVDEYTEDWARLWWARADGVASVLTEPADRAGPVRALVERYPQYAGQPPAGPVIRVDVRRWSGWAYTAREGERR
jgi:PPOX class probable F420-dependent enzyme